MERLVKEGIGSRDFVEKDHDEGLSRSEEMIEELWLKRANLSLPSALFIKFTTQIVPETKSLALASVLQRKMVCLV